MDKCVTNTKELLNKIINCYCDKVVDNYDLFLLDKRLQIPIEDFLYIIEELDEKYQLSLVNIVENSDFSVFTINNLVSAMNKIKA